MNQAFSKVLQQERSISGFVQFQDESKILVNASATNNRGYGRGRGLNANKVCTYYGKIGHTVEVCYKKHGFPPHFKFKNASAENVFQDDTYDVKASEEESTPKVEVSQQPVSGLTHEQYKTLMTLLQQANL